MRVHTVQLTIAVVLTVKILIRCTAAPVRTENVLHNRWHGTPDYSSQYNALLFIYCCRNKKGLPKHKCLYLFCETVMESTTKIVIKSSLSFALRVSYYSCTVRNDIDVRKCVHGLHEIKVVRFAALRTVRPGGRLKSCKATTRRRAQNRSIRRRHDDKQQASV